ncbi:MAG: hypothetical protein NT079_03185, partial [Candidatus Omnitrophica bacterium]|nr:hypothetical protein [Candidatus Omnitrophota bacterium]
ASDALKALIPTFRISVKNDHSDELKIEATLNLMLAKDHDTFKAIVENDQPGEPNDKIRTQAIQALREAEASDTLKALIPIFKAIVEDGQANYDLRIEAIGALGDVISPEGNDLFKDKLLKIIPKTDSWLMYVALLNLLNVLGYKTQDLQYPLDAQFPNSVTYIQDELNALINGINANPKYREYGGIITDIDLGASYWGGKGNSFTQGTMMFGSDIDGLILYFKNDVSPEIMDAVKKEFAKGLQHIGIDGFDNVAWKKDSLKDANAIAIPANGKIEYPRTERKAYDPSDSVLWIRKTETRQSLFAQWKNLSSAKKDLLRRMHGLRIEGFFTDSYKAITPTLFLVGEDDLKALEGFRDEGWIAFDATHIDAFWCEGQRIAYKVVKPVSSDALPSGKPLDTEGKKSLKELLLDKDVRDRAEILQNVVGVKPGWKMTEVGNHFAGFSAAAALLGAQYTCYNLESLWANVDLLEDYSTEEFGGSVSYVKGEFSSGEDSVSGEIPDHSQNAVVIVTGALSDPAPQSNPEEVFKEVLRVIKSGGKLIAGTIGEWKGDEKEKAEAVMRKVLGEETWKGVNVSLVSDKTIATQSNKFREERVSVYEITFPAEKILSNTENKTPGPTSSNKGTQKNKESFEEIPFIEFINFVFATNEEYDNEKMNALLKDVPAKGMIVGTGADIILSIAARLNRPVLIVDHEPAVAEGFVPIRNLLLKFAKNRFDYLSLMSGVDCTKLTDDDLSRARFSSEERIYEMVYSRQFNTLEKAVTHAHNHWDALWARLLKEDPSLSENQYALDVFERIKKPSNILQIVGRVMHSLQNETSWLGSDQMFENAKNLAAKGLIVGVTADWTEEDFSEKIKPSLESFGKDTRVAFSYLSNLRECGPYDFKILKNLRDLPRGKGFVVKDIPSIFRLDGRWDGEEQWGDNQHRKREPIELKFKEYLVEEGLAEKSADNGSTTAVTTDVSPLDEKLTDSGANMKIPFGTQGSPSVSTTEDRKELMDIWAKGETAMDELIKKAVKLGFAVYRQEGIRSEPVHGITWNSTNEVGNILKGIEDNMRQHAGGRGVILRKKTFLGEELFAFDYGPGVFKVVNGKEIAFNDLSNILRGDSIRQGEKHPDEELNQSLGGEGLGTEYLGDYASQVRFISISKGRVRIAHRLSSGSRDIKQTNFSSKIVGLSQDATGVIIHSFVPDNLGDGTQFSMSKKVQPDDLLGQVQYSPMPAQGQEIVSKKLTKKKAIALDKSFSTSERNYYYWETESLGVLEQRKHFAGWIDREVRDFHASLKFSKRNIDNLYDALKYLRFKANGYEIDHIPHQVILFKGIDEDEQPAVFLRYTALGTDISPDIVKEKKLPPSFKTILGQTESALIYEEYP